METMLGTDDGPDAASDRAILVICAIAVAAILLAAMVLVLAGSATPVSG